MRFTYSKIEQYLEWGNGVSVNEIIIESPSILRDLLGDLVQDSSSKSANFLENGHLLEIKRDIDIIFNPFKLDFNNRRAMATLLKMLVKASISDGFYEETNQFKSRVLQYLDSIVDSENFIFEVGAKDDFSIDSIAKAVNLRIIGDNDDFCELLIDYMSMMVELSEVKMFIFVGLRPLLEDREFKQFIRNVEDRQINVLLIESRISPKIKRCGRIIVDADFCEL